VKRVSRKAEERRGKQGEGGGRRKEGKEGEGGGRREGKEEKRV
jgi:hypothetical protein